MKIPKLFLFGLIALGVFSCNYIKYERTEVMEIVAKINLDRRPEYLGVKDSCVYACLQDSIAVVDVSNPAKPNIVTYLQDWENHNYFEAILVVDNILYAACSDVFGIYSIDISNSKEPKIASVFNDNIIDSTKFGGYCMFSENNSLWAVGITNYNESMIIHFQANNPKNLIVVEYFKSNEYGIEQGITVAEEYVYVSTDKGFLLVYDKNNISIGPIFVYSYVYNPVGVNEGRTIGTDSTQLFWADNGAGFVSFDMRTNGNVNLKNCIKTVPFQSINPNAIATEVLDFLVHSKTGKIYYANGWCGLTKVDPKNSKIVAGNLPSGNNFFYSLAEFDNYVIVGIDGQDYSAVKGLAIVKVLQFTNE